MESNLKIRGFQELQVIKADGTVRKQFQEYKPFAWVTKNVGFSLPRVPFVTGRMVDKVCTENLITNAGLAAIADLIGGVTPIAAFDYIAVGTGTTAAAAGDTTLETEITDSGLARAQDASPTRSTTTQTNDTLEINYSWSVTGTKAVTEMGLLNAASSGTLVGRNVFAAVNVANGDTLNGTYKIVVA